MIEVVAALIWQDGKFLICQRSRYKSQGLLWEFVGGKVEAGEKREEALVRECEEELSIIVQVEKLIDEVKFSYPEKVIHLSLFSCKLLTGLPQLLEHEDLRWITPKEVDNFNFCPADQAFLDKIKIESFIL